MPSESSKSDWGTLLSQGSPDGSLSQLRLDKLLAEIASDSSGVDPQQFRDVTREDFTLILCEKLRQAILRATDIDSSSIEVFKPPMCSAYADKGTSAFFPPQDPVFAVRAGVFRRARFPLLGLLINDVAHDEITSIGLQVVYLRTEYPRWPSGGGLVSIPSREEEVSSCDFPSEPREDARNRVVTFEEDPDYLLSQLESNFQRCIDIWSEAGLFTADRVALGYEKPNFKRHYKTSLASRPELIEMMRSDPGLLTGYNVPVWSPVDVPFYHEDPDRLSYLQLLKSVIEKCLKGWFDRFSYKDTPACFFKVGPQECIVRKGDVDLEYLFKGRHFSAFPEIVYGVQQLHPQEHAGFSEDHFSGHLKGVEDRTGGVFRLERAQLLYATDGKLLNPHEWRKNFPALPSFVTVQDLKQAAAFLIYCLETRHWFPDSLGNRNPKHDGVALALNSYVPNGNVVPALYWSLIKNKVVLDFFAVPPLDFWTRFWNLLRDSDRGYLPPYGVRVGIRVR